MEKKVDSVGEFFCRRALQSGNCSGSGDSRFLYKQEVPADKTGKGVWKRKKGKLGGASSAEELTLNSSGQGGPLRAFQPRSDVIRIAFSAIDVICIISSGYFRSFHAKGQTHLFPISKMLPEVFPSKHLSVRN